MNLPKPSIEEMKRKLGLMNNQELEKLKENRWIGIRDLYHEQPDVKAIKAQASRLTAELREQTKMNLEERKQLNEMFDQYDSKYCQYVALKNDNEMLKAQQASLGAVVSKQMVVSAIQKKASEKEDSAKAVEKSFLKEELDARKFMREYIKERGQYHEYHMTKVKVNQS